MTKKRQIVTVLYIVVLLGFAAGVFYTGAISQLAFQKASGQSFTFLDLNSRAEITIAHSYAQPYLRLFIDYDVAPFTDGYQDLFQTADINAGVRMEFAKNTSAIVFGTVAPPYGFGVQIHNLVRRDHRQDILIRALDRAYVWTDDSEMGRNMVRIPIPHFLVNHVIIGQGFDASRSFSGHVYRVDFSICEYSVYRNWMISEYIVLGLFLAIGISVAVRKSV